MATSTGTRPPGFGRRPTGGRHRASRATPLDRIPAPARRAAWNLIDQVISAGTNAALAFLVARSVDDTSFGGFAVALTVFAVAIGASRAVSTSPLGIRFSNVGEQEFRYATGSALGTAVTLGAVVGAGCLVVGSMLGGVAGQALMALGVVLPALLMQDAWRYVFFAAARPAAAAANDAVWAVVQIVAVLGLLAAGQAAVGALVLAWGLSAFAAALLGVRQGGARPHPRRTGGWLKDHRDLTGYVAAEVATLQLFHQGALLVIATIGSLQAIGALRGAQVLLGPISILAVAAFAFAVPELARKREQLTRGQWMRFALLISGVASGLGFCWGLLFLVAPDAVGLALLGDTWDATNAILWPSILAQVGAASGVGFAAVLYAMDRAPITMFAHIPQAFLLFGGGVGGVQIAGAQGAAWGFVIAYWSITPIWIVCVLKQAARTERKYRSVSEPDPEATGELR